MGTVYNVKLQEIDSFAKTLAGQLQGGETLALSGPLGSGKTTFTKALAKNLHVKDHVTSPTFVIMHQYNGSIKNKPILLYHLDVYRTKNLKEVRALGISEIWNQSDTVTVIEWAEKIKKILPKNTIKVTFSHL